MTAEEERAAVVAFLEAEEKESLELAGLSPALNCAFTFYALAVGKAASAIKRGEHHKGESE